MQNIYIERYRISLRYAFTYAYSYADHSLIVHPQLAQLAPSAVLAFTSIIPFYIIFYFDQKSLERSLC